MLRGFLARLRALLFRSAHEAELSEELRYHFDREVERRIAQGESAGSARASARRAFGRDSEHRDGARSAWRWRWVAEVRQDVHFAMRTLRREPGLVATVMLTIGLGVGPGAAAFTLFNAYVLRPPAVADPGALYTASWNSRSRPERRFTWAQLREITDLPGVAAATGFRDFRTRIEGKPIAAQMVTGNFFTLLGLDPVLGRLIQPADAAAPGTEPIAVLSHRYWTTEYGADSSVVGRSLRIRGTTLVIIGVAPEDFDGVADVPPDFWVPLTMATTVEGYPDVATGADAEPLSVLLRLRRGTEPGRATAAIDAWMRTATAELPEAERVLSVELESRANATPITAEMLLALAPIIGAFALVFLAACANIASLMIARGVARQRETGVRLAIGAGRGRLIRQLLTESLLLSLPAVIAGLIVSRLVVSGSLAVLATILPESFRSQLRMATLEADHRVQIFIVLATVGSAVIFGLIPALQATRADIVRATRGEVGDDIKPSRLRRTLLVGQITVAALLLMCTGVMLRGNQRARRVDMRFDTKGLLVLDVADRSRTAIATRIRERPEILGVASSSGVPLLGGSAGLSVQAAPESPLLGSLVLRVSPEFFDVLRIDLRAGRSFLDDEMKGDAPVAIVNEALATELWGAAPALDRSLLVIDPVRATGSTPPTPRSVRVVGVAPDILTGWIGQMQHRATVFLPIDEGRPNTRLVVRATSTSTETQRALEKSIDVVSPGALDNIFTMDDALILSTVPLQIGSWIGAAIGLIALALTLTGVYGVMAFTVARRTREIGVRIALGATRASVTGLIMKEMLRLAAWGIGTGTAIAVAITAFAASFIKVVHVVEPIAYLGGALVVLAGCLAGAVIPSRRAARVEPLEAIRVE